MASSPIPLSFLCLGSLFLSAQVRGCFVAVVLLWFSPKQLIKARQDERYSSSPESRSRNTSRLPSQGRSPSRARLKRGSDIEDQEEEDDVDESMTKHHVRFSISLPMRPKESLPFLSSGGSPSRLSHVCMRILNSSPSACFNLARIGVVVSGHIYFYNH